MRDIKKKGQHKQRSEREREGCGGRERPRDRERFEKAALLAFKVEKGATSQGMQTAGDL